MSNDTQANKNGLFIALEGADGSGKTSMTKYFVELLNKQGFDVVKTREFGGTPIAEKLRGLITNSGNDPETIAEKVNNQARLLMILASRIQHVQNLVFPNVKAGKIVVTDRCFDSTHVYQGVKEGMLDLIKTIQTHPSIDYLNHRPDYTIFLDVSPEVSMERTSKQRDSDNNYNEGDLAMRQLDISSYRQRMVTAAEEKPGSILVVEADKDEATVKRQLEVIAHALFQRYPNLTSIPLQAPAEEAATT